MKKISSRFKLTIKRRNAIAGYLFISPWVVGMIALGIYPIIQAIQMSFSTAIITPGSTTFKFVKWDNYWKLYNDANFRVYLLNDLKFFATATPIILVFSLIIAVLLNGKFRFRGFFRAAFFLPVIVISGPVSNFLLAKDFVDFTGDSFLFSLLSNLPMFLLEGVFFILQNILIFLWFSGIQILMFLAALQKVDRSLYEAAKIDGGGGWECFWKITLPHVKNFILINGIYTIVEFANFAGTGNRMANTFTVANISAFQINEMNPYIANSMTLNGYYYVYSAAMSWIYFIAILLLVVVFFVIFKFFERGDRA